MTSRNARQLVAAMIVLGLVALRTPIYAQNEAELWEAIARGDLNTLQRALESGLDPDVREPNGATPLIVAAMFGHLDLVRLLVENTAALDVQNQRRDDCPIRRFPVRAPRCGQAAAEGGRRS